MALIAKLTNVYRINQVITVEFDVTNDNDKTIIAHDSITYGDPSAITDSKLQEDVTLLGQQYKTAVTKEAFVRSSIGDQFIL